MAKLEIHSENKKMRENDSENFNFNTDYSYSGGCAELSLYGVEMCKNSQINPKIINVGGKIK